MTDAEADTTRAGAVLALCRAVWPIIHRDTLYDGWAHWPQARELQRVIEAVLNELRLGTPTPEAIARSRAADAEAAKGATT